MASKTSSLLLTTMSHALFNHSVHYGATLPRAPEISPGPR